MRHAKRWLGLIIVLGALASANACSNQGEGERCDKNSGDADCESGLVCTTIKAQATTVVPTNPEAGQAAPVQATLTPSVCCPPQGQIATTQACQSIASTIDVIDAGSGGAPAMDAGSGSGGTATGGSGGSTGGKDAAAGGSAESGSPADASLDSSRD